MTDVARLETDLEIARGELEGIARLLTSAGIPEKSGDVPLHIGYRVRIALGMETLPSPLDPQP